MNTKNVLKIAAYAAMVMVLLYGAACIKTDQPNLPAAQRRIDRVDHYLPVAADWMTTYLAVKYAKRESNPHEWERSRRLIRDLALVSRGLVTIEGAWVSLVNQRNGGDALSLEAVTKLQKVTTDQWRRLEELAHQLDTASLRSDEARIAVVIGMSRMRFRLNRLQAKWAELPRSPEGEQLTWNPFDVDGWYHALPSGYEMPPLKVSAKNDMYAQLCEAYYAVCLASGGSLLDCYRQLCECSDCEQPAPQGGD